MGLHRIAVVSKRPYSALEELARHFKVCDDGEICIAVGGDGTFLEAARKHDRPILLIRGGEADSLGFHAEADIKNLNKVIERLKSGAYTVEKYPKLRIGFMGSFFDAVNDAVLVRSGSKVIHCRIEYYDDKGVARSLYPGAVRGDGIVIARQLGSTAYNFFAHGPVLFGIDAVVVTPISANYRVSVVSDRSFRVELIKGVGSLQYDGLEISRVNVGDSFTVARSDKVVRVVRLEDAESFSDRLGRLLTF
jgi:NAD+ kinase